MTMPKGARLTAGALVTGVLLLAAASYLSSSAGQVNMKQNRRLEALEERVFDLERQADHHAAELDEVAWERTER